MADELRDLLSRIENLLVGDGTSGLVYRAVGSTHCRLPEISMSPNDKMPRIEFKQLDDDTLIDIRRLAREKFSSSSEFQRFTNSITELAPDTDQDDIGDIPSEGDRAACSNATDLRDSFLIG